MGSKDTTRRSRAADSRWASSSATHQAVYLPKGASWSPRERFEVPQGQI